MQRDLQLLKRHYYAQSPSIPSLIPYRPFPSAIELCKPATQDWLVDNVLHDDSPDSKQIATQPWAAAFWKRVVKGIEQGFLQRREGQDQSVEDEVSDFVEYVQ